MTVWLPIGLAAAAAAVLVAPPSVGRVRLGGLVPVVRPATALPWPVIVAGGGLVVLGPAAAVVGGVAAVLARRAVAVGRVSKAARAERSRALEALAVLSADLRAGRVPSEALSDAATVAGGATARALASAASADRLGGDVPAALTGGPSAVPEVMRGLAACWSVCSAAGSGLAAGVERLAEGLRAAEAHRRAVDAELAGPRATAALLAGLPVGGIVLAAALGADPLRVLLHTPAGVVCLALGLSLDAAGLLWTRQLVARVAGR